MRKLARVLFLVVAIATLVSMFNVGVIATSTAVTNADIYIGEYDSGELSGIAHIIFGTVSDDSQEYGVVLTDVESGKSYAFPGKAIGDDGKFGIAIYDMPAHKEYIAKVYSGSATEGVFGDSVTFVSNVSEPTILVESVEAQAGDIVTVAVKVVKNPGILSMTLTVNYDDSAMVLTSASNGDVTSALTFTPSKNLSNPCNMFWDGMEISDEDIKDGEVLLLTFEIDEQTEVGEYDVYITYYSGDIFDKDINPIDFALVGGKVIVK